MSDEGGTDGLVFLDACCLINLLATGRAEAILRASRDRFAVARLVAEREVLERSATGAAPTPHPALAALIEQGTVERLDVTSATETRQLVRFASDLDDGEAHTLALAIVRGARVATDDRKAIRIFHAALAPEMQGAASRSERCVRTSELVFAWADAEGVTTTELSRVVGDIAHRASFLPPRNDPHFERWLELLGAGRP